MLRSENTHHRGKYHCSAAGLQFNWIGFDQKSEAGANDFLFECNKAVESKHVKLETCCNAVILPHVVSVVWFIPSTRALMLFKAY